jgi:predicted DNA-binding protein (MmcQ/YjbR family)
VARVGVGCSVELDADAIAAEKAHHSPMKFGPNDQGREEYDRHVSEKLSKKLDQLFRTIEFTLAENLWEPTLILIYSGIDAMAWLDRPAGQADVHGPDFQRWVDEYLLPDSGLTCTAADLYGARCGMLHSHTGESRKHRELQVKKVFYHRVWKDKPVALIQLKMNEKFLPPSVNLDQLAWAFHQAITRFFTAVNADAAKEDLVSERIDESYLLEVTPVL